MDDSEELRFRGFDPDLILQLVSSCSAVCLAKLICSNLPVNKQINWIAFSFFFFLRQILSVCSQYLSMTERMCACGCVFIYMMDPWQKLLCLATGTVSVLCSDDMCETRDAVQSDTHMLCT